MSQNKRQLLYICDSLVRYYPILLIFGITEKTRYKTYIYSPLYLV